MSTIEHWDKREPRYAFTALQSDSINMIAEITELREALKVAQAKLSDNTEDASEIIQKLMGERDALQAKLSEIEGQEPVAEFADSFIFNLRKQSNGDRWPVGTKLYAAPVAPAQPVNELVEASERILSMGILAPWNGQVGYFFPVNIIQLVDKAIANAKAAQPPYDPIGAWNKGFEAGKRIAEQAQPLTKGQAGQVLDTLCAQRVMAKDENGNYTKEVTPQITLDAITIMQNAIEAEIKKGQQ